MEFLSYLITGISLGSIYAIIALGYTMVYGIAKMLNFAHGDVIMVGAYVSFYVTMFAGNSLLGDAPSALATGAVALVSVLLAMAVCTVLGVVIEGLAYRPLRQAGSLAVLITAIGVSYFLQNSALLIWKAAAKTYPPVVTGAVQLFNGQLTISYISLLTIAACIVIMLALTTFVSQNLGAKAYDRVKKGIRVGIFCSVTIAETVALLIFIFSPKLIGLFTGDAESIAFGVMHERTTTPFFFLLAYSHCMAAIFRGAGKSTVPMLVMMLCWCIIRVIYVTVAVKFFPVLQTVSWAYPITWGLSTLVFTLYYFKADWMHAFERREKHA